jgi:hypothetical protein
MGQLSVGSVQIPAGAVEAFAPGVSFSLKGPFCQVLQVSYLPEEAQYRFLVVRDEHLVTVHEKDQARWQKLKAEVETQGKPFDKPEPTLEGPPLMYLRVGADSIEVPGPGTFIGQVGDYVFFSSNPPRGGLFGLFG